MVLLRNYVIELFFSFSVQIKKFSENAVKVMCTVYHKTIALDWGKNCLRESSYNLKCIQFKRKAKIFAQLQNISITSTIFIFISLNLSQGAQILIT